MFREIESIEDIQKGKVIVDFYSKTCAPCKRMLKVMEQLASQDENINIIKIDTASNIGIKLAADMHVSSLPSIKILEDGEEKASFIGITNPNNILEAYKL